MKSWKQPKKNVIRSIAVRYRGKQYKIILVFPSSSCLDLIELLKNKVIGCKTFIIIVEKEHERIEIMKKKLIECGLKNYYIHEGSVDTLQLGKILGEKKIEYMFFDICGNLTEKVAKWFNRNQFHFAHNMVMPVTFQIAGRGPQRYTTPLFRSAFDIATGKPIEEQLAMMETPFVRFLNTDFHSKNLVSDIYFTYQCLLYAFSKRQVTASVIYVYRDRIPMIMIDMVIKGKKKEDKTFAEIIKSYNRISNKQEYQPRKKKISKITCKSVGLTIAQKYIQKYDDYDDIKPSEHAHIKRYADKRGLDVIYVRAGIKRAITLKNRKKAS